MNQRQIFRVILQWAVPYVGDYATLTTVGEFHTLAGAWARIEWAREQSAVIHILWNF